MKKSTWTNILLLAMLLIGLSLLLYPALSDYWNSFHQSQAIAAYTEQVAVLENEDYQRIWQEAGSYNERLLACAGAHTLKEEEWKEYENLLNPMGNGIMGHIEIPVIGCSLPIYHGTEDTVLQTSIGHLEWTSLPTGGESTHSVLSGHRGLPSAKLFTDLDQLSEGDIFMLCIMDEVLTYQVDQILIVEPEETKDLQIETGKDLCTLVTCTPYGVNSHRLLVQGYRIENREEAEQVRVTSDAVPMEPLVVAAVLIVPILIVLFGLLFLLDQKSRRKEMLMNIEDGYKEVYDEKTSKDKERN